MLTKKITTVLTLTLLITGTVVSAAPQIAQVASMFKCIAEVKVKLGQKVKKGQFLFECNQDILKIQKKFNEQDLKFNKLVIEGAGKLIKSNAISLADYQESVKDRINATEALSLTEIEMKDSKYYAPFDGTVTKIIRYTGSGLGDNDDEIEVTEGDVLVDTKSPVALVCTRYPGVLELKVKLAQKVKKGDLLFTSNTDAFEAKEIQTRNLKTYFNHIFTRRKKLLKTHTVSEFLYITAENDYNRAVMNYEIVKLQIAQSSCHAPFDGTVTEIFRYSGSGNGSGKPVLNITGN